MSNYTIDRTIRMLGIIAFIGILAVYITSVDFDGVIRMLRTQGSVLPW